MILTDLILQAKNATSCCAPLSILECFTLLYQVYSFVFLKLSSGSKKIIFTAIARVMEQDCVRCVI